MSVVSCEPGFGVVWGLCMECPPGMYSSGGDNAVCLAVPKGFYAPLYGSSSFELPCEKALLPGAANCAAPSGECKWGSILEEGKCVNIPEGYFNPFPSSNVYYSCMANADAVECAEKRHRELKASEGKPWTVHRYLMNELNGNVLVDYQKNGKDKLVNENANGELYNGVEQRVGYLKFSGPDGYGQLQPNLFYNLYKRYGSFSVEFFVDTTGAANANGAKLLQIGQFPITGKAQQPSAQALGISKYNDAFAAFHYKNNKPDVGGRGGNPNAKFDNMKHHVVLTVSQGGAVEIYVDGSNKFNGKGVIKMKTFPQDKYNYIGLGNFQGKINELNIYAGALDINAIKAQYLAGPLPFSHAPSARPTDLIV